MFKAIIKKNGVVTNVGTFDSQAESEAWVTEHEDVFPEGFQAEYIDIPAQELSEKESAEAFKYLASTDWYVIRKSETSVDVPVEVLNLLAEARLKA